MTAPRPEIQRWDCGLAASEECGDWGDDMVVMREDETGKYILYSDHLRAVTRAKIEVLEDLLRTITNDADGYDPDIANEIEQRIAALRKELEG